MSVQKAVLSRDGLAALLDALRSDGFRLLGPTVRDGAIVYAPIEGLGDLPEGVTEVAEAGRYRLERREDQALFGFAVGPESFKRAFFEPTVTLFRARRQDGSFTVLSTARAAPKVALIGARSCDLHAIAVQDRVFMEGAHVDPRYAALRQDAFVLAVNCGEPGGACFCVSMGTGPAVSAPFDLALTEIIDGRDHHFLVEIGSERGGALVERVPHDEAREEDAIKAEAIVRSSASRMGRTLDTKGIKELFYENLEHPRWDDVADRCLACANCTLVCPTCFCSTVEDVTDLERDEAARVKSWDSCFTLEHSYVHGGSVRASIKSRYRQWLTHKLASWIDQFGTSGCVGCGRCIVWCPVGIDITEETRAIRGSPPTTAIDEG